MVELVIERLASEGDGMARIKGAPVFVAGALSGETVEVEGDPPHMDLVSVTKPSPHRVAPPCPHFEQCGNCTFQHLAHDQQLDWKRQQVAHALGREKLSAAIEPCLAAPLASRRRVTFTARRDGKAVLLGYMGRSSHDLVDIASCPIALPQIVEGLETFRALCGTLLRGREDVQLMVTAFQNGLDLAFTLEHPPGEDMLAAFTRAFARSGCLRASINGDVIAEREKPVISFGGSTVSPPPGGFLQALREAEEAMAALVCHHLKGAKKVADLFCGSGTFALPLAAQSKVTGVEGEEQAVAALSKAVTHAGTKPVVTAVRDLEQLPLTAQELKPFDGICLDPPRAGALPQVQEIAKASIPRLAYVSCNPQTFARDAAVLVKGGYRLEKVVPLDQFVFSTHVEVVGLFTKARERKKRSIFR
ncbi:MAG: class I SAM-dependent RNA methyltransferase [Pseudomonadota bacterium]